MLRILSGRSGMFKDPCKRSWKHRSCRIISATMRPSRILLISPCLEGVGDSFRILRDVLDSARRIFTILAGFFGILRSFYFSRFFSARLEASLRCWAATAAGINPHLLLQGFRPPSAPLPPRSASLPALCIFLNSFFPSASTLMLIDEDVAVKDWSFYLRISLGRCRHRRYSSASIDIHWHSLTSARMILIIVSPITILIQIMDNGSPFSLVVATTHSSDYQRFRLPASAMINLLLTSLMIVESFLSCNPLVIVPTNRFKSMEKSDLVDEF